MAEVPYGDLTQNDNTFTEEKLDTDVVVPPQKQEEPTSVPAPSASQDISQVPQEQTSTENAIQVTLASSEKVGEGMLNSHVEYTMNVKTSLPNFKESSFSRSRRFKDFVWLREQLSQKHKGYLIPPLPEASFTSKFNRFDAKFLEYRKKELEKFLARVASHPILLHSQAFQIFLEENTEGMNLRENQAKKEEKPAQGAGQSIISFFGSTVDTISSINFGSPTETDTYFSAKKNYINGLEIQMINFTKSAGIFINKSRTQVQTWQELSSAATMLSLAEGDRDPATRDIFSRLQSVSSQVADITERLCFEETLQFEENLKDFCRILGAVKEMLKSRDDKLAAYQGCVKTSESRRDKFNKNKTNNKLLKELEEAEKKQEEAKVEFEQVSDICKSELEKFETMKKIEIRLLLTKFCQLHINNGVQNVDQWKGMLKEIFQD